MKKTANLFIPIALLAVPFLAGCGGGSGTTPPSGITRNIPIEDDNITPHPAPSATTAVTRNIPLEDDGIRSAPAATPTPVPSPTASANIPIEDDN